jgi:hypothetical protein
MGEGLRNIEKLILTKKPLLSSKNFCQYEFWKADDRTRTDDRSFTKRVLYQLSYIGNTMCICAVMEKLRSTLNTEDYNSATKNCQAFFLK